MYTGCTNGNKKFILQVLCYYFKYIIISQADCEYPLDYNYIKAIFVNDKL